jgi:hypothetical protein
MVQQVMISTDAPVALKPLLESAIRSELRMMDLGLERTRQRLQGFEAQYGINSREFARRFATGEIAESLDTIEWAGEIETYRRLEIHWRLR